MENKQNNDCYINRNYFNKLKCIKLNRNVLIFSILLVLLFFEVMSYATTPLVYNKSEWIGRNPFFKSDLEYSYYLPMAFSSEFECQDLINKKVSCQLMIFNLLKDQEIKEIHLNSPIAALSDLSYNIVNRIDEWFEFNKELFSEVKPKEMILKNLRLSESPYATANIIISSAAAGNLLKQYQSDGIGQFNVKVKMKARKVNFLLSIKSQGLLKQILRKYEGRRFTSAALETALEVLVSELPINSLGFSNPKSILKEILKAEFFQTTLVHRYGVKRSKVNNLSEELIEELILIDDTTDENPLTCISKVILAKDKKPETHCFIEED